jgi:cation:H+ antiporter
VAFTAYLVLRAQEHAALATFSSVMVLFVVPLTVLTLGVTAWQAWRQHGLHSPHGPSGPEPDLADA